MAVASPAGRKHKLAVTANLCFKAHSQRPSDGSKAAKRRFKSQLCPCQPCFFKSMAKKDRKEAQHQVNIASSMKFIPSARRTPWPTVPQGPNS